MKALITQSNYIPWKGYFDAINQADFIVLYDEMQYTKRDWRNRNKIKTPQGLKWLSVPVEVKGKYHQKINETKVTDPKWAANHLKTIHYNYSKAPFYKTYQSFLADLYERAGKLEYISEVNYLFLTEFCKVLNIQKEIRWSKEFELRGDKTEKLLNICLDLGANHYYSGPAARNYMDVDLFEQKGVTVEWLDYSGYPEYPQIHGDFEHGVSVIDLILNTGTEANKYLKSFSNGQ